jgi:hypothetical protein
MEPEFTAHSFDYDHQAWTALTPNGDRVYLMCGHTFACGCYGKTHAGEKVWSLSTLIGGTTHD